MQVGYGKIGDFRQIDSCSRYFLLKAVRKSYALYRIVRLPIVTQSAPNHVFSIFCITLSLLNRNHSLITCSVRKIDTYIQIFVILNETKYRHKIYYVQYMA